MKNNVYPLSFTKFYWVSGKGGLNYISELHWRVCMIGRW